MSYHSEHLRWSLQALALPAAAQRRLFPLGVSVPDELVLDFDEHWRLVQGMTQEQQVALQTLDASIDMWSGLDHPDVWDDGALETHPVWEQFRELASQALHTFSWPVGEPPFERGKVYIV